jgi:CheY-like chemotaxis protein
VAAQLRMKRSQERAPSPRSQTKPRATPSLHRAARAGPSSNPGVSESLGPKPIRILVVDDHPIVRQGLINSLAFHKRLVVVGEAGDGVEALAKARELSPDLVLMDIDLPKLSGLSAAETLHRKNQKMRIVFLSDHNPGQYGPQILKSGALGCVSKQVPTEQLIQAIETLACSNFFGPEVAKAASCRSVRDGRRWQGGFGSIRGRHITCPGFCAGARQ